MAGAKLGNRVVILGCRDPQLIAGLASKTGLTGRTVAVDTSAERAEAARHIALGEGALVETVSAPFDALPLDADAFDLVVLRDVLPGLELAPRLVLLQEAQRVLRPGGRCIVIDSKPARGGLANLFRRKQDEEPSPEAQAIAEALRTRGFVAVRPLAEREGLMFVEGVKRNPT
jgi:ubiquinone/menaquinone biosynthesis C-methylase UbiE